MYSNNACILSENAQIIQEFLRMNDLRHKKIESASKYRIGQSVKITDDIPALTSYLETCYAPQVARRLAERLSGKVYKIQFVDELYDSITRAKGMYYNVEDEFGFIYVLPEEFLSDEIGEILMSHKKTIVGYVKQINSPDWIFETEDKDYTITIPAAIDQILDITSKDGEKFRITVEKLSD